MNTLDSEAMPICSHICGPWLLFFQSGDTVLIGAVRGGHVEIVRALLQKYADIDIRGQVRATQITPQNHF